MASSPEIVRSARSSCLGALLAFITFGAGCANDYPLQPTACDTLCEAGTLSHCDSSAPAECVFTCEQQAGASRCQAEIDAAFACIEQHPSERCPLYVEGAACDREYWDALACVAPN